MNIYTGTELLWGWKISAGKFYKAHHEMCFYQHAIKMFVLLHEKSAGQ